MMVDRRLGFGALVAAALGSWVLCSAPATAFVPALGRVAGGVGQPQKTTARTRLPPEEPTTSTTALQSIKIKTGNIMAQFERDQLEALKPTELPYFAPGDTLAVDVEITEGNTKRVQQFAGVCIRRRGAGLSKTFTVRKISFGIGVERTFPVYSPIIKNVKVTRRGSVRRARLYYLRQLTGKSARIKEKVRGLAFVARQEEARLARKKAAEEAEAAAAAAAAEAEGGEEES